MEAISIVALVLGIVAVVLLIAVLALTVRDGKKKNDSSVEIGQATVDVIKGEIARDGQTTRENVLSAMGLQNTSIQNALNANQTAILDTVRKEEERTERLQTNVYEGFATLTTELKNSLKELNESNEKQLDKMRATVDEKLNENLEQRFQKSFQMVSERIDAITKGFGEMQTLTSGMSDLKRVLSNVKTRGTWGEMALDNLLSQLLTPEQYDKNVALTKSENADRVDFVINLPGKTSDKVMLPIDAKFPLETGACRQTPRRSNQHKEQIYSRAENHRFRDTVSAHRGAVCRSHANPRAFRRTFEQSAHNSCGAHDARRASEQLANGVQDGADRKAFKRDLQTFGSVQKGL